MTATILPFPSAGVPLAVLAREAGARWTDCALPMLQVAMEMIEQEPYELRARTRAIVEQRAQGLLVETDRALAETAADLSLMVEAIGLARQKLHAATLAQMEEDHA